MKGDRGKNMSEPATASVRSRGLTGSQSVSHALYIAEVAVMTLIQPVFVIAAVFSDLLVPPAIPLGFHTLALALGTAAWLRRLSPGWLVGATCVACLVDLAVAPDGGQLLFGFAFIILALVANTPLVLWGGARSVVASAGVAVVGAVTVVVSPAGDLSDAVRMLVTIGALGIAVAVLVRGVRGFASMADAEEASVQAAEHRGIARQAAAETAAEYARTLHDTVINTFSLLARDAHSEHDGELVRDRCRSNLERIAELRGGPGAPRRHRGLVDLERVAPVSITWMDEAKVVIRDTEPMLPRATARAMFDCAAEAVTNAAKHAGVDTVYVSAYTDGDDMIVAIRDDGSGFDGELVPGRGLAESLFARAEEHGIRATLRTVPGHGTTIELSCATKAVDIDTGPLAATDGRAGMAVLTHMALVWSFTMHGASVTIAAMDPRIGPLSLIGLAVIVTVLTVAFWLVMRTGRDLPRWLVGVTLTLVPVIAWLGYEAGDQTYGLGGAFPPLLLSGVCAFLLVMTPTPKPFFAAIALAIGGLAVTITTHAYGDAEFVAHGIVMQAPVFGLLLGWYLLYRVMLGLGQRLQLSQARRSVIRRRDAIVNSAQTLWERWSDAGIEASLEILRDIEAERVELDAPELKTACRREESHLRQVCAISSGGMLMSWWLARALAEARTHDVELRLQVEGVDIEDPRGAAAFGRLIISVVDAARPGSIVTATLTTDRDGRVSLMVVSSVELCETDLAAERSLSVRHQVFGEQALVTAAWEPRALAAA